MRLGKAGSKVRGQGAASSLLFRKVKALAGQPNKRGGGAAVVVTFNYLLWVGDCLLSYSVMSSALLLYLSLLCLIIL